MRLRLVTPSITSLIPIAPTKRSLIVVMISMSFSPRHVYRGMEAVIWLLHISPKRMYYFIKALIAVISAAKPVIIAAIALISSTTSTSCFLDFDFAFVFGLVADIVDYSACGLRADLFDSKCK